ncbi:Protein of unknown function [Malonomonas rubra DSM 5091]|uniref:DUF721 domain-containing protein n=1 Tax=Malonomonas rubra DSM 5091 TaxID=1122189 RepID=A0A1M6E8J2_MALRU|nr:DUF721 domain-containing protein [Malonomonas rubra]SHI81608.1 Protein of unknown function [Malonomonas rubra DSM 5091]
MSRKDRAPMKKAERVGPLLKKVLGDRGMEDRLNRYQAWLIWDQVVGKQIAERARPLRFRQGILEVQVDHPVWMQQLQMLKPQILQKLNQQLPNANISDLFLRKAPTPYSNRVKGQKEPEVPKMELAELTDQEQREIEEMFATLHDTELQAEMKRVATLQKRLNKGRSNN